MFCGVQNRVCRVFVRVHTHAQRVVDGVIPCAGIVGAYTGAMFRSARAVRCVVAPRMHAHTPVADGGMRPTLFRYLTRKANGNDIRKLTNQQARAVALDACVHASPDMKQGAMEFLMNSKHKKDILQARSRSGQSCMHRVCGRGDLAMAQLLGSIDARNTMLRATDTFGRTPFHSAVLHSHQV